MKFTRTERKAISLDTAELVTKGQFRENNSCIVTITPKIEHLNLGQWIQDHSDTIEANLQECGGVLFRGFHINGQDDFSKLLDILSSDQLLEYKYKSTPRTHIGNKIYTSTEYPADQVIPMHNEMSYSSSWPMRIVFYSEVAAETDGATPLADSIEMYKQIPAEIRDEFERKKVMYVRNYADLDLSWQDVFQTSNKDEIETFCKASDIQFEWINGDRLRTWQVCDAVQLHPVLKEKVWFNQAHLFHVSALNADVRERMLALVLEDELPRNACFGDGSKIDDAVIALINEIYRENSVVFSWQNNDLLLLDNMRIAHGRHAYTGKRKLLVGMY